MNPQETATNAQFFRGPHDGLLPVDGEGFDSLAELALDMRRSENDQGVTAPNPLALGAVTTKAVNAKEHHDA